ncbi:NosD domain-containing protein [Asanoa siamensis]|uniref:Periplasmic copper-binding protein NosD beta helix domain-containing protein n=1 Tax=Asanoa siamensis TaxID=926357 RepID=A0ABQ4CZX2_9ACTN|nr:NosD domain-containing protein [Asanoa siamensis]GIF76839.1 hypothetical protein Asi02nite_63570 [Asanoa siamensis]
MRAWRTVALSTVGLLLSLTVTGVAATAAAPSSTIYVSSQACASPSDGSWQRPYCTIGAAVAVAEPGQTVYVRSGVYAESVVVTRSGEPGRPITIRGERVPRGLARITPGAAGPGVTLAGVHDVVVAGFEYGTVTTPAVVVDAARDVEVTDARMFNGRVARVVVRGASRGVAITRTWFQSSAAAIFVEAGATGTVIAGNSVLSSLPAVSVTDAPDTVITNNTLTPFCRAAIVVDGASPRLAVQNNIIDTAQYNLADNPGPVPCAKPDEALPLTVSAASAAGSTVDYNVVNPVFGGPLYSWAGTRYATPAEFRAATGQAAHDIAADPQLDRFTRDDVGWTPRPTSPAVDSGRADAPGVLPYGIGGDAHADNPDVPNTGTGIGYVDRGSVELSLASGHPAPFANAPDGEPLTAVASAEFTSPWVTDGPSGTVFHTFDDGFQVVTRETDVRHTFPRAGEHCVNTFVNSDSFRTGQGSESRSCVVVGAGFTAVPPSRVLDTRAALGVPTTTPVAANSDVVLPVGPIDGVPADRISAVVLNVTVTQATKNGYITAYPGPGSPPTASNLLFEPGQTVAALVTVPVSNGAVRFRNGSAGTVHVIADLAGFYGAGGHGITTREPLRVLDTRAAVGVPGTVPVPADGRVEVDLTGRIPAGTTAVVLNATATGATNGGLLTFFPPGGAVPTVSNLNFGAGQTIANMVIAPVVNGKIALSHTGRGTVHVLVDLAGQFAAGGSNNYVPTGPVRILDTRELGEVVLGPGKSLRVYPDQYYWDTCLTGGYRCRPTSVVATVTLTRSTTSGYVTAYPSGDAVPTASTVNFAAGQTISNLATVATKNGSFDIYNGGRGSVHVIVDQAGYYLAPPN